MHLYVFGNNVQSNAAASVVRLVFARLIESLEYFLLGFILYAATGVGKGQFQICASYGNIQ